jgi:hypothetical protein
MASARTTTEFSFPSSTASMLVSEANREPHEKQELGFD